MKSIYSEVMNLVENGGGEEPVLYKGKYGEGYTIKSHNPNSTNYCYITYYINE